MARKTYSIPSARPSMPDNQMTDSEWQRVHALELQDLAEALDRLNDTRFDRPEEVARHRREVAEQMSYVRRDKDQHAEVLSDVESTIASWAKS